MHNLPDSLQGASFRIPKLYDISQLKSDILVLYSVLYNTLQHFTLVMHNLPDSLQCASFKIPKLYDISQLKSDILVLYKCKALKYLISTEKLV